MTTEEAAGAEISVGAALADFLLASQEDAQPEATLHLARLHVLDTLASIVACRDLEPAVLARRFALAQSGDARASATTILGTTERAAIVDAVFAGAMTAHAAEINDFIPSAFVQPGPAVVAVALAVAERRRSTGAQFLRAVVAGYELAGRTPKALGLDNLRRAGIANHGIGPVFGAAAAAASLMRFSRQQIGDVWTYCAQQASGSWQWLLDVEHIEKSFVFAGMGARNGLAAALMVEAGFRGVRDCLDAPGGWLRAGAFAGGDSNLNYLIDGLGTKIELVHTAYKRYPVGGPTQPAVEGLLRLLPKFDPTKVESVRIAMPGRWQAFRDAAMPALNLRYLCAIILRDRRLDFVAAQSLERMRGDESVHAIMARVEIEHDPEQEAPKGAPRTESARVTVRCVDGEVFEVFVPYVVGFPSHPMSPGEVVEKALELMTPHLGAARAREVVDHVEHLDAEKSAATLTQLIAR